MNYFELKQFVWDKGSRQLIADASTLGIGPASSTYPLMRIKSHHTGKVEQFDWSQSIRTPDGQCVANVYSPANVKLGIKVTVFNT